MILSNKIIRATLLFLILVPTGILNACPVCERNQPKVFKGVVHGAGPDSQWDYVIMWAVIAITVASLYYSVKWLIKPGETEPNHIKYSILNEEQS